MGAKGALYKGSKAPAGASLFSRLLRLGLALYVLAAVASTAHSFVIAPALRVFLPRYGLALDAIPVEAIAEPILPPEPEPAVAADEPRLDLEQALEKAAAIKQDAGEGLWSKKGAAKRKGGAGLTAQQLQKMMEKPDGVEWDLDQVHWHPVNHALAHQSALPPSAKLHPDVHRKPTPMAEDFFLSKAFGESLQPSKIIPYYFRASQEFTDDDITITTLVTSNRLKVLAALVERYRGPVSVTIHVDNNPATRNDLLESLDGLYHSAPYMSQYVDVHLVVDRFDRNVAKFFARTNYVMMLDVDFWICTDFRSRILNSPEIISKLREGSAAFVIPAFEYNKQEDGVDASTFPQNKQELMDIVKSKKIDMFHKSWQPGHGASNYTRYYASKPGEVYRVHAYTHSYEPYVVYKREGTPYCDERFVGYGANKAACLYELYLSGVSFFVLPDDFLIHQSHPYAEKARKHERKYNRQLYTNFREEACFRYLNYFIDNNQLASGRAKNLLMECRKIKGFSASAQKLIQ